MVQRAGDLAADLVLDRAAGTPDLGRSFVVGLDGGVHLGASLFNFVSRHPIAGCRERQCALFVVHVFGDGA